MLDGTTGIAFTTRDLFFGNGSDPLSWNKYGFVHGDPVLSTDPTGKSALGVGLSIGTVFAISATATFIYFNTYSPTNRTLSIGPALPDVGPELLKMDSHITKIFEENFTPQQQIDFQEQFLDGPWNFLTKSTGASDIAGDWDTTLAA